MTLSSRTGKGFTIVELLIVIVIIGTIATLSIRTFGGAVDKAENSKISESVGVYTKALLAYAQETGSYPDADADGGEGASCLGEAFPDLNGDSSGDCYYITSSNFTLSETTNPTDNLRSYIGNVIPFSKDHYETTSPTAVWQPGFYRIANVTLSGVTDNYAIIQYSLDGANQDCNQSPLVDFVTASTIQYVNDRNYSRSFGESTLCNVLLRPV